MKNGLLRQGRRSFSAILAAALICTSVPADLYVKAAENEGYDAFSEYADFLTEKLETPELTADELEVTDGSVKVENDSRVVVRVVNPEAFGDNTEVHYTLDGQTPSLESALYDGETGICVTTTQPEGETVSVKAVAFLMGEEPENSEEAVLSIIFEGDVSEGDVSQGDVSHGDVSEGDVSQGDVSQNDVSQGDSASGEEETGTQQPQLKVMTYRGKDIALQDGSFLVQPEDTYFVYLVGEDGYYVSIAYAEFAESMNTESTIAYTNMEDGARAVELKIADDMAGKKFALDLYQDKEKTQKLETAIFQVTPHLTSVTVEGVKNGVLVQEQDTEKYYTITRKETNSNDSVRVLFETRESFVGTCGIDGNGKLVVSTRYVSGEKVATVYLYNGGTSANPFEVDTPEQIPAEALLCKFDLTVSKDEWQTKKASVKQLRASDTDVVIEITSPTGKKRPSDMGYRYEVTAEAVEPVRDGVRAYKENAYPDYTYDGKNYTAKATADLRLFDSSVAAGEGGAQSFNLTVKPYIIVDGRRVYGMETRAVISTVDPYYPEKLVLKNQKKQVYTGQYCKVADLDFGKNNSYIDDSLYSVTTDNRYVQASIQDGSLYVRTNRSTDRPSVLGKVNITVKCDLEKYGLPPVSTKLTLQVVQGIEDLELVVPKEDAVTELYKQPGKALKLNTRLVYNYGYTIPKAKKVGYSLGVMQTDGDGNKLFVEDAGVLGGAVKISTSGVITISKDYKLDSNPDRNRFAIRVYAKDYEGNESTESFAEIQLTEEKASMGEPVLTVGTDEKFEILSSVTVEDLRMEEVQVRVLKPGVDRSRTTFSEKDLTGVPYTISLQKNKFMVAIGNRLELKSIANLLNDKFVITVTSQNGSKESKKLSFQIENKEYKEPRVYVYGGGAKAQPLYTKDEEEVKEQGGVNQMPPSEVGFYILGIGDGKKNDADDLFSAAYYPSDYKINVKGGKVWCDLADVSKFEMAEAMVQKGKVLYVYFTSPKVTITLTNSKGKKIAQYELENTEFKNVTITPKVTVEKSSLPYTGYTGEQKITFTLDQKTRKLLQDKDLTLVSTYGDMDSIRFFDDACMEAPIDKVTGKVTMSFKVNTVTVSKAKLTFYIIDTKTRERLSKNSALVTVQAVSLKKSFKLNASCKLSASLGESVELTGKAAGVKQVTYRELYNVSTKGKSNRFAELFELGEDQKLKLRDDISQELKSELLKDKKNLTGYVYLEVTYLDGTTANMYQKITIKLTK